MIDVKTRKKIIKLYEQGESKASIQKQTGITQPTIRKVLRKAGLDRKSSDRKSSSDDSDLEDRVEQIEEQLEALKSTRTMKNIGLQGQPSHSEIIDSFNPVDTFIINLTRNWPYRSNMPLQCLYNGAPIWEVQRLLKPMYTNHVISRIMQEIKRQGQSKVYEVTVVHYGIGREDVTVKMLNGYNSS